MEGGGVSELPLLLSLPPELLALSASKVQEKAALRLTCRATRLAVDVACTQLVWWGERDRGAPAGESSTTWIQYRLDPVLSVGSFTTRVLHNQCITVPSDGPLSRLSLAAVLPASCPNIKLLDCHNMRRTLLVSLVGCPSTMQTLICPGSGVVDLDPLAACTGLQTLDCGNTLVADLGPLAACTGLKSLRCVGTKVADLGPLAACTGLLTLHCDFTRVSDVGPLAACTGLQGLSCDKTRVSSLGPLASCTGLGDLKCSNTTVSDLATLAACTGLRALYCGKTRVSDVDPLAACPRLQCLYCDGT